MICGVFQFILVFAANSRWRHYVYYIYVCAPPSEIFFLFVKKGGWMFIGFIRNDHYHQDLIIIIIIIISSGPRDICPES